MSIEEFLKVNPHELKDNTEEIKTNAALVTVSSRYLSINIDPNSTFTNSGSIIEDNNYRLAFNWPYNSFTSYTTVRIDGINYIYGQDGVRVQKPINITPALAESSYQYGDILVTQNVQVIFNPYTERADMGKYTYTVKNLGSKNHSVGIRIMHDSKIAENDAPDFVVAGSTAPLEYETMFTGQNIPRYFVAYRNYPKDLNTLGLGILKDSSIKSPTKVAFGQFYNIYSHPWDITLNNRLRGFDNAFAVYFGEITVCPNQEFMFTNFYGLGTEVSIPFEDTVTLTTSEESCIIDTTSSVDVQASSNIFAYKYSYNENDCNNEDLVRGDIIGFTLVFGNYGPLGYTANTSENTIVDTLSIAAPMNLQVVSLSIPADLSLIDLNSGYEVTTGTIFAGGDYSLQVLKLQDDGSYSGAFDLEANSVYCISMLLQIQF